MPERVCLLVYYKTIAGDSLARNIGTSRSGGWVMTERTCGCFFSRRKMMQGGQQPEIYLKNLEKSGNFIVGQGK